MPTPGRAADQQAATAAVAARRRMLRAARPPPRRAPAGATAEAASEERRACRRGRRRLAAPRVKSGHGALRPPSGSGCPAPSPADASRSRTERRHRRVEVRRRHRHARQVIVDQAQGLADTERRAPGRHLVQGRTQRVQVGPVVDGSTRPPGLFRRHVRQACRRSRCGARTPGGSRRTSSPARSRRGRGRRRASTRCSRAGCRGGSRRGRAWPPPRARAAVASSTSSGASNGFASLARLWPPASANTIDPGYRGASSSCATPSTPRSRSRIAVSWASRASASGPSGSLRMTVRSEEQPGDPRACVSRTTSERTAGCGSSRTAPSGLTPQGALRIVKPRTKATIAKAWHRPFRPNMVR